MKKKSDLSAAGLCSTRSSCVLSNLAGRESGRTWFGPARSDQIMSYWPSSRAVRRPAGSLGLGLGLGRGLARVISNILDQHVILRNISGFGNRAASRAFHPWFVSRRRRPSLGRRRKHKTASRCISLISSGLLAHPSFLRCLALAAIACDRGHQIAPSPFSRTRTPLAGIPPEFNPENQWSGWTTVVDPGPNPSRPPALRGGQTRRTDQIQSADTRGPDLTLERDTVELLWKSRFVLKIWWLQC